jgi:hypothetical protein
MKERDILGPIPPLRARCSLQCIVGHRGGEAIFVSLVEELVVSPIWLSLRSRRGCYPPIGAISSIGSVCSGQIAEHSSQRHQKLRPQPTIYQRHKMG